MLFGVLSVSSVDSLNCTFGTGYLPKILETLNSVILLYFFRLNDDISDSMLRSLDAEKLLEFFSIVDFLTILTYLFNCPILT